MNDTEEKEVEETRKLFQDFLLEIPEDYLIKRAAEIEKDLGLDLDEELQITAADLDERYKRLMKSVKAAGLEV